LETLELLTESVYGPLVASNLLVEAKTQLLVRLRRDNSETRVQVRVVVQEEAVTLIRGKLKDFRVHLNTFLAALVDFPAVKEAIFISRHLLNN